MGNSCSVLYCQTDPKMARQLISTQRIPVWQNGPCGAAIYFADTPGGTEYNARGRGQILKCQVALGRIKEVEQPGDKWSYTLVKFLFGYDSLKVNWRGPGYEYVVFEPNRVTAVQKYWQPLYRERSYYEFFLQNQHLVLWGFVGVYLYIFIWDIFPTWMFGLHAMGLVVAFLWSRR